MAVEGQWRTYSITLAWSPGEEVLRLICTFDMDPPTERLPQLYEVLNLAKIRSGMAALPSGRNSG